jgi:hypothetical protein
MQRTGLADLPLHHGKAPRWLFNRIVKLVKPISQLIVEQHGRKEFLRRISDPYFFQCFANVVGWDWHSSGSTPVLCGALKLAIQDLGIGVAGGKGKASRKAPKEIQQIGEKLNLSTNKIDNLIKTSKLTAKVDNALLQDSFTLYHHTIFFTKNTWAVVQQGMNDSYARRYHWLSSNINSFTNEPHTGIISDLITSPLNLTAKESRETRNCSLDLIKDNPIHLKKYFSSQTTLSNFSNIKYFIMKKTHFPKITPDMKTLIKAYEMQPKSYEELILIKGMGPKNIRALSLISHLIYGTELSWKDPVKYSFAHGGKDGWPSPVNKERYDQTINFLQQTIKDSEINKKEKLKCLKKLNLKFQVA